MATLLAGQDVDDPNRKDFNLAMVAIAPGRGFAPAAERMTRYLKSSRALDPNRPVMVPGDPERIARANPFVEVDPPTWEAMKAIGRELEVELPPE
jgi:LDH2 family malate/lactate/ureidoglycolate dehydrogenase